LNPEKQTDRALTYVGGEGGGEGGNAKSEGECSRYAIILTRREKFREEGGEGSFPFLGPLFSDGVDGISCEL